jgi:hypothetical protein
MSLHWLRSRWRSRGEYFAGFFRWWRDPRIVALVFVLFIIVVWFVRGGNSSDSFDGEPGAEGSRQAGVECRVVLEAGERALRELRRDC